MPQLMWRANTGKIGYVSLRNAAATTRLPKFRGLEAEFRRMNVQVLTAVNALARRPGFDGPLARERSR